MGYRSPIFKLGGDSTSSDFCKRKRKSSLEVFGVAMGVATISGLLGGVALQFEAFFIHDQQLKWKVFKWQHETFLTIHHILLTSAGAGALVGLTLGLVACKLTSK